MKIGKYRRILDVFYNPFIASIRFWQLDKVEEDIVKVDPASVTVETKPVETKPLTPAVNKVRTMEISSWTWLSMCFIYAAVLGIIRFIMQDFFQFCPIWISYIIAMIIVLGFPFLRVWILRIRLEWNLDKEENPKKKFKKLVNKFRERTTTNEEADALFHELYNGDIRLFSRHDLEYMLEQMIPMQGADKNRIKINIQQEITRLKDLRSDRQFRVLVFIGIVSILLMLAAIVVTLNDGKLLLI